MADLRAETTELQDELERLSQSGSLEDLAQLEERVDLYKRNVDEAEAEAGALRAEIDRVAPRRRNWVERVERVPAWVGLVIWIPIALFTSIWLTVFLLPVALTGHIFQRVGRKQGKLTLGNTWYAFILAFALSALGFGLAGFIPIAPRASYDFMPDAGLQDGYYVRIGETNGTYLLVNCDGTRRVTEVDKANVATATYSSVRSLAFRWERQMTLWEVLAGSDKFTSLFHTGFTPSCPENT